MKKKRIISIVGVVAVCALILGVYAFNRQSNAPTRESVIPIPERSASTTVPYTAYNNAALGVRFAIPADWKQIPGKNVRIESPDFAEEDIPGTLGKRVVTGVAISFDAEPFLVDDPAEYVTLIEEAHESPECGNCLTGHRITFAGVPAHLGFASIGTSTEPSGAIISLVTNGNSYRLLMSFDSYTSLNQEILAEIIHTFAFTK